MEKLTEETTEGKRIGYLPPQGMVWNPLLRLPRNSLCPCGALKKFKHCHLRRLPTCIPIDIAKQFNEAMKSGAQLEFTEDDNLDYGVINGEENHQGKI